MKTFIKLLKEIADTTNTQVTSFASDSSKDTETKTNNFANVGFQDFPPTQFGNAAPPSFEEWLAQNPLPPSEVPDYNGDGVIDDYDINRNINFWNWWYHRFEDWQEEYEDYQRRQLEGGDRIDDVEPLWGEEHAGEEGEQYRPENTKENYSHWQEIMVRFWMSLYNITEQQARELFDYQWRILFQGEIPDYIGPNWEPRPVIPRDELPPELQNSTPSHGTTRTIDGKVYIYFTSPPYSSTGWREWF